MQPDITPKKLKVILLPDEIYFNSGSHTQSLRETKVSINQRFDFKL